MNSGQWLAHIDETLRGSRKFRERLRRVLRESERP